MPITRAVVFSAAIAALLLAPAVSARTVDGVDFPDSVDVAGATLTRNGIGARTVVFVRFYLAALYVEKTGTTSTAVLSPDRPREVRLHMLKDVSKARFEEAARSGFEHNTPSPSDSMKQRQEQFLKLVPALVAGDTLTFTYEPGVGTRIKGNKVKQTVIPGKDFADALFRIWLGAKPVDDGLKKGLLGKDSL